MECVCARVRMSNIFVRVCVYVCVEEEELAQHHQLILYEMQLQFLQAMTFSSTSSFIFVSSFFSMISPGFLNLVRAYSIQALRIKAQQSAALMGPQ